ncbi:sugar transferase [Nocardia jejuensis]|uniref:sugar transferase n=1 Tax=Nocardia jejuensis TaxID=328049 RepID=UPI0008355575|nr:sugar transferase [Nocardia jejuensis]
MSFEVSAGRVVRANRHARSSPHSYRERWQADYARRLWISDLLVICGCTGLAQYLTPGNPLISLLLAPAWVLALSLGSTRTRRIIGSGAEEYRRVVVACLKLFGAVAVVSVLLELGIARGYLLIAFGAGTAALVAERLLWHRWVASKRAAGDYRSAIVVVGTPDAARAMVSALSRDPGNAHQVVGVCTRGGGPLTERGLLVDGREIPIVGNDLKVADAVRRVGADTVAITTTGTLNGVDFRLLAWELDELGVELLVTAGLVDIAGTRLTHRLVADQPMLQVAKPRYDRAKLIGKSAFDFGASLVIVLALAPVLLGLAVAIRSTTRGPVFYLSERIGRDGRPFRMIKFRSMYAEPDAHLNVLLASKGASGAPLDPHDDPRVTPLGAVMRRYGLDELPQFFNVLRGEMSIVGPRPQVQHVVDGYDGVMRRTLLVRPGLTGLWQVSGRARLTPEDAMRLDLSYVENWSTILDLHLIAKTIGAARYRAA